ncbi:D-alanyl-D-alanine carboxypeptidase family protein [Holdemania filiformis]|uniref:D-alanyl-D-alanine carboxypeptidase n=1 Tax=Holdemania filiformis TaxID=61171 RepID=A0A412G688_9FIRM|nr:D-alanyl-D-alanine carboxypeptidase family protein [Holdemania filiformis]MBS5001602.1 D-alanyl-D-alanine carboxypeptidase [Holdemania filiformis]RGR76736.1 D-alanyl-D-alanine carboxypeptidase [Holdemania filiformis]
MKKIAVFFLTLMLFWTPLHADGSYIVISGNDGNVLEAENEHEVRSIASISKIMTAVVALENGDYIDQWIIGDEVTNVTGSMIWIQKGQQVSMRSLLYGMMLKSGNDAAVAIAHRVGGGSVEKFIQMMNEKAAALGMKDTEFHNPNGMDVEEEGNYSTAYDMALLMQYAMTLPQFREIVATQFYTSEWGSRWKNSNKLLSNFEFCTGGKTGFTNKAGETLVTAAQNGELEYIVVTLAVPDRWTFHEQKYRKAMEMCELITLQPAGPIEQEGYIAQLDKPFEVVVKKEEAGQGQYTMTLDKSKNELTLCWTDPSHTVVKTLPAVKPPRKFCFWRWCV